MKIHTIHLWKTTDGKWGKKRATNREKNEKEKLIFCK